MIVEVEGQEIEFPDSMTQAEVAAVLRKQFPAKPPAQPTKNPAYLAGPLR